MLPRCTKVHGFRTTIEADPRLDTFHDVLYVPHGTVGHASGIYDRGRRLVTVAGCFHGLPDVHPGGATFVSTVNPDDVSEIIEEPLIFAGHFSAHYGHFLTSTLSRYWWIEDFPPNLRLLVLNRNPVEDFFSLPFVAATLGAIGLSPQKYMAFDRPVRIASLIVPAASFEENNLAHRAFARLCNKIGDRLAPPASSAYRRPAYLSKSRLRSGVSHIVNETEFTDALERYGIDILFPETLGLADQISVFRDRIVCGPIGSAFHTGIFTSRNRLVILNDGDVLWSNQLLFDGINDNRTTYVHPGASIENRGRDDHFDNNFFLLNPKETADAFAQEILSADSKQMSNTE